MRTLNPEEIRLVAEINEKAQGLDIIRKAKALGFILGLGAEEGESTQKAEPQAAV